MMSARWCTVLYRTVLRTSNTSKCLTPVRRCRLLHVVARLRPIGSVAGGARPCLIWGARGGCCPPVRLALGDRRDLPVVRWGRWWHLDPTRPRVLPLGDLPIAAMDASRLLSLHRLFPTCVAVSSTESTERCLPVSRLRQPPWNPAPIRRPPGSPFRARQHFHEAEHL